VERILQDLQEAPGREAPGTVNSCVFCRILRGDAPEPRNFETDKTVASFTPLSPVVPGHRLFIPRHHVQDAAESPFWVGILFMAAADYASRRRNAFNLITSAGEWATQGVMHLYVHYIPRQPGDKLHLPWA
jgi:histidine triad (HIT) family protein